MHYILLIFTLLMISCNLNNSSNQDKKDSREVASIRKMNSLLIKKEFKKLYQDWCHPHLTKQLTINEFDKSMNSKKGEKLLNFLPKF